MIKTINQKKKKGLKKIACIFAGAILMFVAVFPALVTRSHATKSGTVFAQTEAQTTISRDTAFLHAPTSSVTLSSGETITLDEFSGKLISSTNGVINQQNTTSCYGATDIFTLDDCIVLVNKSSVSEIESKIIVLGENKQRQTTTFVEPYDDLLQGFDHVKAVKSGDALHFVLFPDDFSNGICYFTLQKNIDDETFVASNVKKITFTEQLLENNFASFKGLNLCESQDTNTLYAVVHSGNTFFKFDLPTSGTIVSNIATEENNFTVPLSSKVHTFSFNNKTYMMLQNQTTLEFHEYTNTPSFRVDGNLSESLSVELSSIDAIHVSGSTLTITSTIDKKVVVMTIGVESGSLTTRVTNTLSNPEIQLSMFTAENIKFIEITGSDSNAEMKTNPYDSQSIVSILPQSKLVWIGSGYTGDTTISTNKINGYEYCLYTGANGVNYYGFVEVDKITELDTPTFTDRTFVYARGGSKIYRYPSRTVMDTASEKNSVLFTTTDLTRLEVKRDISAFYYQSGNGNNFFFEVELPDGSIGYVQDTNVDKSMNGNFVQTNAVVLRTSVIYTNSNPDANNTIFTLHEATRVRIVENRHGNEKYTKISFNDDNGNYYTGYILSENIKADSWSSMQLIGLVLVVFSVILLGVILIVRNRLNHE